jgi:predicted ester cyclase
VRDRANDRSGRPRRDAHAFQWALLGHVQGRAGRGQPVDFIATDIYRVERGRIAEDWHIEDNLTLLTQFGVVKP